MPGQDDDIRHGEVIVAMPEPYDAGLWFIGRIRTPWTGRWQCPRQGDPLAGPDCRIELDPRWLPALTGLEPDRPIQLLYWMDAARRDLVLQRPRGRTEPVGTFSLRSPARPNPIASSVVQLLAIDGPVLTVRGLDCLDGTPLLDIKPTGFGHGTGWHITN